MIERSYTLTKRLVLALWGALGGSFFALALLSNTSSSEPSPWPFVACALLGIVIAQLVFARPRFHGDFMKNRPLAIEGDLAAAALPIKERGLPPTRTSNFSVLAARTPTFHSVVSGESWHYADHTHAIYEKTKHGEYKAATVYYSFLEITLPRALPNMIFDSQRSHRKQFAPLFDSSQRHSLEGDFDQHFATYFPKYYTIDALSIITPEVMQAMMTADAFDIEIAGNKLYLYGPLVPTKLVPEMIKNGLNIRDKLMNNLTTYRDERLNMQDGRQGVSVFGAQLRENPYKGWTVGLIGAGLFLLGLYGIFADRSGSGNSDALESVVYGLGIMGGIGFNIWRKKRKNQQLDDDYALQAVAKEAQETQAKATHA